MPRLPKKVILSVLSLAYAQYGGGRDERCGIRCVARQDPRPTLGIRPCRSSGRTRSGSALLAVTRAAHEARGQVPSRPCRPRARSRTRGRTRFPWALRSRAPATSILKRSQAHERLVHGGAPGSPLDLHRFTHPDLALLDLGCLLAGGSNTKVSRTRTAFPSTLKARRPDSSSIQ